MMDFYRVFVCACSYGCRCAHRHGEARGHLSFYLVLRQGTSCVHQGVYSKPDDMLAFRHFPVSLPSHCWSAGITDAGFCIWIILLLLFGVWVPSIPRKYSHRGSYLTRIEGKLKDEER